MKHMAWALAAMVAATNSYAAELPQTMCDDGAFIAGGSSYSFEDIKVEGTGAISLNEQGDVTAYGYVSQIAFGQELLDQIGAVISTVDGCYQNVSKVTVDLNTSVDVVFVPRDFDGDGWKNVRRSLVRVDDGFQAKALVKLTGSFGIFSNTYGLYFRAKSIEVVSSFK